MYKVIDNFLKDEEFKALKNLMLGGDFSWYYNTNVSCKSDIKGFYFTHGFFIDNKINSSYYNQLQPIINKLNVKALVRAKGNLYTQTENIVFHNKHLDYEFEHKGAIFYINTNNGFTVIEDDIKIESVENRLLMFEPHKIHGSTNCTDEKVRVNINFNYF